MILRDVSHIEYNDYARKTHEDGREYGTFRSYVVLVSADYVTLKNLRIKNTSGYGKPVGQAIALYADADCLSFYGFYFSGRQDTVFADPLPPKPRIPGSFVGPSKGKSYRRSRQHYDHCRIEGDIDFIFGSAMAVFNRCVIVSLERKEEVNGYVTAPATWSQEPYGFVFYNCNFVGETSVEPGTVYLGRPWREYGQTMLIGCYVDKHIHEKKWDPWGNEGNKKTAKFSEYNCIYSEAYNKVKQGEETPFIIIEDKDTSIQFLDAWHLEKLEKL